MGCCQTKSFGYFKCRDCKHNYYAGIYDSVVRCAVCNKIYMTQGISVGKQKNIKTIKKDNSYFMLIDGGIILICPGMMITSEPLTKDMDNPFDSGYDWYDLTIMECYGTYKIMISQNTKIIFTTEIDKSKYPIK